MESIKLIKDRFQAAPIGELPDLIIKYEADERKGVISIVDSAKRTIIAEAMEDKRLYEMRSFERKYYDLDYICGIDEAGRGPLCGPVVAAAVILPRDMDIRYVDDSKKLSQKKREELYDTIMENAISVGVGMADHHRIDEINIKQATREAMAGAVGRLSVQPDILLIDAEKIPNLDIRQVSIVKGDARSQSIAAASIIAKVTRDRLMEEYDRRYPGYGFAKNSGYGVAAHIQALQEIGPCEIHRKTFIKKFVSV